MLDFDNVREQFAIDGSVVIVGNQKWIASVASVSVNGDRALVSVTLEGPHERRRSVRIRLDMDSLGSDATLSSALERIARWLPHSDTGDVLEL